MCEVIPGPANCPKRSSIPQYGIIGSIGSIDFGAILPILSFLGFWTSIFGIVEVQVGFKGRTDPTASGAVFCWWLRCTCCLDAGPVSGLDVALVSGVDFCWFWYNPEGPHGA